MINKLLTILLIFSFSFAMAQKPSSFCGTEPGKSEWLKRYQAKSNFSKREGELLQVPLSLHVVGEDDGTGYLSITKVLQALCTLNNDFTDSDIQFFIEGDIHYLDNTEWTNHESFQVGRQMMNESNIDNTINCYIVKDAAGNCGYSSFGTGIALAINCIQASDHTWAHELGHYLSLPHTFYGWEGGIGPDNENPNFNNTAPEYVYFHHNGEITDSIEVEKVDGSNCADAADGFCDTAPDYIFSRWSCNDEGFSSNLTDPNGEKFKADGSLFMSYANDECSSRFSLEQNDAMRASAIDRQKYYLDEEIDLGVIESPSELYFPVDSTMVHPDAIQLEWESIDYADHYIIYVSRYKSFSNLDFRGETTDNTIEIPNLKDNKRYYWKVFGYGRSAFCNEFSEVEQFLTSSTVATTDLEKTNILINPNTIFKNQEINIQVINPASQTVKIEIINISGQSVYSDTYSNIQSQEVNVPTLGLQSGLYMISCSTATSTTVKKIIIN